MNKTVATFLPLVHVFNQTDSHYRLLPSDSVRSASMGSVYKVNCYMIFTILRQGNAFLASHSASICAAVRCCAKYSKYKFQK